MSLKRLLERIVPRLEKAAIPYMLAGSVASAFHGEPRSTLDLDIVIDPTPEQLLAFVREFPPPDYYADEQQALEALAHRSQFNILDNVDDWKVDFMIAEQSRYGRAEMARRQRAEIAGTIVYVCSPEDTVVAKLRWAKMGASDRQLRDVAGILKTQLDELDNAYIEQWVNELGLRAEWDAAKQLVAL